MSGFLYDFDICHDRTNKKVPSDLGMSSQVVKSLCGSFPSGHNFKTFDGNFFNSVALLDGLKKTSMYFVRTVKILRLKN